MKKVTPAIIGLSLACGLLATASKPGETLTALQKSRSVEVTALQHHMYFEENKGQSDAIVNFVSRGAGYSVFLTPEGAILRLTQDPSDPQMLEPEANSLYKGKSAVLGMTIVGASEAPAVIGEESLSGVSHYLKGKDPKEWVNDVRHFRAVRYSEIYRNIDLVYQGNQGQLQYDFVLKPGANANAIKMRIRGADSIRLRQDGSLVLETILGELVQQAPLIFQDIGGERRQVAGGFELSDDNLITFHVADYDAKRKLIIDPTLDYSTYLGGTDADEGDRVFTDSDGNIVVSGSTNSVDFPVENALQPGFGGSGTFFLGDAFVSKFTADGSTLLFSTYVGGSGGDFPQGMTLDSANDIVVGGRTESTDFPTIAAFQPDFAGGILEDAFVFKLAKDGSSLIFSTYLGGVDIGHIFEEARAVIVDGADNIFVIGNTSAPDFPTTHVLNGTPCADSGDPREADVFIAQFDPTGSLVFATCFGGTSRDAGRNLALDSSGNLFIAGWTESLDFPMINALQPVSGGATAFSLPLEAWVAKVDSTAINVLFSTYLGGTESEFLQGMVVDSSDNVVVVGSTDSADFPVVNAFQPLYAGPPPDPITPTGGDGFVAKIASDGSALVFSTFLGGENSDGAFVNDIDAGDRIYVAGFTDSEDFPVQAPIQATLGSVGVGDGYVTVFTPDGSELEFSSYLGGSERDTITRGLHVADSGSVFTTGTTASLDFPLVDPLQGFNAGMTDVFLARLGLDFDTDGDGVSDDVDVCPATEIPESIPTIFLGFFRLALVDDDTEFDTRRSFRGIQGSGVTTTDTAGCSCEQIVDKLNLPRFIEFFQRSFGCSRLLIHFWRRSLLGHETPHHGRGKK